MTMAEAEIVALGALGDGIAQVGGERFYVPLAAPGDRVRIEEGSVRIVGFGEQRQTPPCRHFGRCGGCRLQHLKPEIEAAFKRRRLATALEQAGYDASLAGQTVDAGGSGRRRVEWAVRVEDGDVVLGFHALRSDAVVDIVVCPVSARKVEALIAPIKAHLSSVKKPGRVRSISATWLDGGIELAVAVTHPLPPRDRAAWEAFARSERLTRLSLTGAQEEMLLEAEPVLRLGGATVRPPVGSFLQATEDGQRVLAEAVVRHVAGARRVIDLYAGLGTFSLPLLAAGHEVSAYEGAQAMIEALWNAARGAGWDDRLTVTSRDLHREPVPAETLRRFDAAVINPPRNGAERQVRLLAEARVPLVAFVSCDPATFARDAAHLRAAGYVLDEAVPVDQFRWSPHVEIVARFRHGG